MTVNRTIRFTGGDQGPQDQSSYGIKIPDPADNILKKTERVKQGQAVASDAATSYYNEWQQYSEKKYLDETRNRADIFKLENKQNVLVADAIEHNFKTEITNIDNRAKTAEKKTAAIQSLIGSAQKGVQLAKEKQLKKAEETRQGLYETVFMDANAAPEMQFIGNLEGVSNKQANTAKWLTENAPGVSKEFAAQVLNMGLGERKDLLKRIQQIDAQDLLITRIQSAAGSEAIIDSPVSLGGETRKITLKEALSKINLNQVKGDKEVYISQVYDQFFRNYSGRKDTKNNPYARSAEKNWQRTQRIKQKKADAAENVKFSQQSQLLSLVGGYKDRKFGEGGGDSAASWSHVIQTKLNERATGQTAKDKMAELNILISYGLKDRSISLSDYLGYRKATIAAKDKQNKETLLSDQFPGAGWKQLDNIYFEERKKISQEGIELGNIKRGELLIKKDSYDQVLAESDDHSTARYQNDAINFMNNGELEMAAYAASKMNGPGSAPVAMNRIVDEAAARLKREKPGEFNEAWVTRQKYITEQKRNELLEEVKNFWPKDGTEESTFVNNRLAAMMTEANAAITVNNTWAMKDAHSSGQNVVTEIQLDFNRRVRENLSDDCKWKCAALIAEKDFLKEWRDGNDGKGKYAYTKTLQSKYGNKRAFPFFINDPNTPYTPQEELRKAREAMQPGGDPDYLTKETTQVMLDSKLAELVNNWGKPGNRTPALIWEFKEKLDGGSRTERYWIEQLLKGYNARNGTNLQLPPKTEGDEMKEELQAALPDQFKTPFNSPELAQIAASYYNLNGNFSAESIFTNPENYGYLSPAAREYKNDLDQLGVLS